MPFENNGAILKLLFAFDMCIRYAVTRKFTLIFSLMGVIKGSKRWFKVVLKSLGNIYNMS